MLQEKLVERLLCPRVRTARQKVKRGGGEGEGWTRGVEERDGGERESDGGGVERDGGEGERNTEVQVARH